MKRNYLIFYPQNNSFFWFFVKEEPAWNDFYHAARLDRKSALSLLDGMKNNFKVILFKII